MNGAIIMTVLEHIAKNRILSVQILWIFWHESILLQADLENGADVKRMRKGGNEMQIIHLPAREKMGSGYANVCMI